MAFEAVSVGKINKTTKRNRMKIDRMFIESPFMRDERRRINRQRIYVLSLMLLSFAVGIAFALVAGGCR